MLLKITIWILCAKACLGVIGYVSNSGTDTAQCGFNVSSPCRTLQYMADKMDDFYRIYLLPHGADPVYDPGGDVFYFEPKTMLRISGSLGPNGKMRLHRNKTTDLSSWKVEGQVSRYNRKWSGYPSLRFYALNFVNISITVQDSRLYVQECKFGGQSKLVLSRAVEDYVEERTYFRLKINETIWTCHAICDNRHGFRGNCRPSCTLEVDQIFTYGIDTLHIGDNVFVDTAVRVKAILHETVQTVTIRNNSFASGGVTTPNGATIDVRIGDLTFFTPKIYIKNCSFKNISNIIPNNEDASVKALLLKVVPFDSTYGWKRVDVSIEDLIFEENHRAFTINGTSIEKITMKRLLFRNNYALHGEGAGLHLNTYEDLVGTDVTISDSIFENNIAGFVPDSKQQNIQIVSYDTGNITFKISETHNYEQMLMGKGGAMALVEAKFVTLINCSFINNSASNFGGSIFQTLAVGLVIENSSFETSGKHIAEHGQILYLLGHLFLHSASFKVHKAVAHVAVVQHSYSQVMSLTIYDISLKCPIGYLLDIDKITALNPELFKGHEYGEENDFAYLDRISLACRPCKRGLYSVEQGYLELDTSDEFGIEVVDFEHKGITCRPCPYGAICEGDIRSVPSYWGYVSQGEIKLEHCIQGHCCFTDPCPGYDHCAENRQGILCSQCVPGYSRATFSTLCVPSTDCGLWWFWPVTVLLGLVYATFLMFEDDILNKAMDVIKKISGEKEWRKTSKIHVKEYRPQNSTTRIPTISDKCPLPLEETSSFPPDNCQEKENLPHLRERKSASKEKQNATKEKVPDDSNDDDPDYLQIMVNFVQDAALFYVYMPNTNSKKESLSLKIFGFTLSIINFIDNACFKADMNPVQLLLMKSVVGPFLILLYLAFYLLLNILGRKYSRQKNHSNLALKLYHGIRERVSSAFMLTLLFSFQSLLITSLTLLDCIEIAGIDLLKIDTTVECYQTWQYVVLGYILSCSLPFPILLMIVPSLLRANIISEANVLFSGIFPLPFVIIWFFKKIKHNWIRPVKLSTLNTQGNTAIYDVLQGPYRDINVKGFGSISWTGITMTKRLLLCVTYTFISNSLIRVVLLMLINLFGMIQLFFHHPYKQINGNRAELFLSGALLMIGMANVVRGAFESAQYIPKGPDAFLIDVIETAENVLLQWIPISLGCLFFMYVILKGVLIRVKKKLS